MLEVCSKIQCNRFFYLSENLFMGKIFYWTVFKISFRIILNFFHYQLHRVDDITPLYSLHRQVHRTISEKLTQSCFFTYKVGNLSNGHIYTRKKSRVKSVSSHWQNNLKFKRYRYHFSNCFPSRSTLARSPQRNQQSLLNSTTK